ncbi:Sushi Repeat-Containing Protein Srpx2, partial [Manis pentadactyla]
YSMNQWHQEYVVCLTDTQQTLGLPLDFGIDSPHDEAQHFSTALWRPEKVV